MQTDGKREQDAEEDYKNERTGNKRQRLVRLWVSNLAWDGLNWPQLN
jgi:hypothetical protein